MRILKIRNWLLIGIFVLGIQQSSLAQSARVDIQQNELIPELLSLKTEMTKSVKLGDRYVIQLYYGDNKKASEVLQDFRSKYDQWPSDIFYETPNYKVWVTNFRSKLEADSALLKIRKDYPAAFIPKPQRN